MTKTTFVNGTPVSSNFLNAINNPTFDGQDFDGHYAQITNSDLSDSAGQIKPEWTTFRDTLKVAASTGSTISYQGGSVLLADGTIATISPASLSVTNNATNYVYVNESGTVAVGSLLPVRCTPLAKVVTSAGAISSVVDLRPRFQISPRANTIPSFGSGGYEGDLTISSNQTLSGVKFVRNFSVASGVTLTVSGFLQIIASGNVTIDGTVTISPVIPGGRGFGGVFPSPGLVMADSGLGYGGGGGHNSSPAPVYPYSFSGSPNPGSGGAAGIAGLTNTSTPSIKTSTGGLGGGFFTCDAAGTISVTGTINCNGGNAAIGVVTTDGGASISLPGAGGGSGGLIWLKSLISITVTAAAVMSVRGGNGANGVRFSYANSAGGGAGGGGGYIVLQSPNTNTSGATITLTGGTGGTASGTPPGLTSSLGGTFGGQSGTASDGNGGNGSAGQLILQSFLPI